MAACFDHTEMIMVLGSLAIGVVGAFIGGFLANLLDPDANFGFWGSIVVAFIGACVLIALLRAFSRGRTRTCVS